MTRHLEMETEGCKWKVGTLASVSAYNKRGSFRQEDVFMARAAVCLSLSESSGGQSQNIEFYYNYIWNLHSLFMLHTAKEIVIMQASQLAGKILPAGPFLKWIWCNGNQNMRLKCADVTSLGSVYQYAKWANLSSFTAIKSY